MPQPERYEHWTVAPKHWAAIPAQRQGPPDTTPTTLRNTGVPLIADAVVMAVITVTTAGTAVTLLVFVIGLLLGGAGTSVADLDAPAGPPGGAGAVVGGGVSPAPR